MFNNQYSSWKVLLVGSIAFMTISCTVSKQISRSAKETVLTNKALINAHVGITIFDPAANKYLYNYQGDKYFVPASNTKLPTCYAAMKYLGDSIIGGTYKLSPNTITFQPNGDPTFLLSEFPNQRILELLKQNRREVYIDISGWQENPLGSGWSWNDYMQYYMTERSVMPMYGNIVDFSGTSTHLTIVPRGVIDTLIFDSTSNNSFLKDVERDRVGNKFKIVGGGSKTVTISRTFDTRNGFIIEKLLEDTLKVPVHVYSAPRGMMTSPSNSIIIKTQPTDSLLRPLMHRSDNFFAEQSLLMVSNQLLGVMNDSRIIDTLLKTDFKDLPQKPYWADGSGLSRYNLFTPQDFVAILNKMKNEFGMDRLKVIMATGGEGTISSYYKTESGFIYGKTGTLSGVVAFSGFLYTKKGKLLIFSTLVNNHQASSTDVRKAIEKFLQGVRNNF